jgi:Phage phiEco32-like COOH.NH2 ligase-type 2
VAIEFNIPPAKDAKAFVQSIGSTLDFLAMSVHSMYGFNLQKLSAASFPDEELEDPAARVFGCDPDYNAWTGKRNPKPKASDPNLRSCGGHIHVGGLPEGIDKKRVIRCMDFFLGVPSALMDDGEKRKELYGKRGAYRDKSYGVEYRTLSNFWVFDAKLRQWAWDNTERAVKAAMEGFEVEELDDEILSAIDKNDKIVAAELCKTYELEVVQ